MAKRQQQQYKTNAVYKVEGASERIRNLVFVGRTKIGAQRYLLFRLRRRVKKRAKKR